MPSSIGHGIYPAATEPTGRGAVWAAQLSPARSLSCITHHVTNQTNPQNAGALPITDVRLTAAAMTWWPASVVACARGRAAAS
jgi:hypothetical protein